MTKKYSTKHALISSILILALCLTSLIGTTFAWFTDSVTSANNIIKSGNLEIEMHWADGTEDPASASWTDASTGAIFDYDNWEPGYVQVRHIKIENKGTLALKYKVNIIANGAVSELSNVIDVYYVDPAVQVADRTALTPDMKLGNLTQVLAALDMTGNGTLEAGANDTITIAFKMQETAGNEYQNKAIGTDFSVQLLATQLTFEGDSFDNQYDAGSTYLENVSPAIQVPDSATQNVALATEDVEVEVPAALLNALPAEVTSISIGYTTPKVDTVNKTVAFDSIEFVDQNGEAIDIEALAVGEKITVTLPVNGAFADGEEVALYHDGEEVAVAIVDNGFVTYEADHFCEVVIVDAESVYDYIVTDLAGLTEAFANGGKVLLTDDVQFEKILPVEPNAEVYLNMNGKKITVNQNTASNTLIYVKDGAKLVIDGNGTIDLEGVSTMAIFAPYGELVIENGTFTRDEVTVITNKTTGIFMGAKTVNSNVVINGGYFDAGYYDENAADIEAILAGEAEFTETADDIAKRNNSKDANVVRIALKDNISAVLNHSGYGTFKVYGGTFVGMNPAWGDEGCMLPTTPDYLRPWSYYQGAFLDGQTFNEAGIVLPEGYTITLGATEAGVPVYTVAYNK